MNTWSGQPEESAWHWTPENCHKLGNVLLLLKCGTAAKREQAYQEFIELKRWFIEEEFDDYLNRLDDLRASMGSIPLRVLIEEIRGERAPVTGWKAKEGKAIDPVMLPEMEGRKHVAVKHPDTCNCIICSGGLFQCAVCNGAEGQLTTECCGKWLSQEVLDGVFDGHCDFVGGKWVNLNADDIKIELDGVKININSPSGEYVVNVNPALDKAIAECSRKAAEMLPEMEIEKGPYNVLVHQESGCAWVSDTVYVGDGLVECHLWDASLNECRRMLREYELRDYSVTYEPEVHKKPVTRYDLFITLIKRGYHALEM